MAASAFATTTAFLGLFFGGAGAGVGLARILAPDSLVADIVSFFALPVAFAAGLHAWYGLALLGLIPGLLTQVGSRSPRPVGNRETAPRRISGSIVFLPLSSVAGAVAGLIVGLTSNNQFWLTVLAYWLLGTVHGLVAWRMARGGVLVPPESV